jgi:hypothetical protein
MKNLWGKRRSAYSVLLGKYEEKRLLARPRHVWEDNCGSSEIGMGHRLD